MEGGELPASPVLLRSESEAESSTQTDEDPKYDYPLIRKVKKSLANSRKAGDARGLMGVLEICLRNNFAGVEGVRMYSEVCRVLPLSEMVLIRCCRHG